jgi:hypothetical protein
MGNTFKIKGHAQSDKKYIQVKVNVAPEIAEAFKAACRTEGVSMAKVLSDAMASYAGTKPGGPPHVAQLDTRRKRRKEAGELLFRLESVLAAEMRAMENTPENLQCAERYEESESIVSALEEATEALRGVYA